MSVQRWYYKEVVKRTTQNKIGSVSSMTKKEMKSKLAFELYQLKEYGYELDEDIKREIGEGDQISLAMYKRFKTKNGVAIRQTKKIAEMFGIKEMDLENAAFDIAIEQATKQLKQA